MAPNDTHWQYTFVFDPHQVKMCRPEDVAKSREEIAPCKPPAPAMIVAACMTVGIHTSSCQILALSGLVSYLLVDENDLADTLESVRRSGRMWRKILQAVSGE